MASAEAVVSELRERLPPIKTKEPPLSTALERVAAAGAADPGRAQKRQAEAILRDVSEALGKDGPDPLSKEPQLLYSLLLQCGDVAVLARAGSASRTWRRLLLEGSRQPKANLGERGRRAGVQRRLWQWVLRWGEGPKLARRADFWRWALEIPRQGRTPDGAAEAQGPAAAMLAVAMHGNFEALLGLSQGLAGSAPGAHISGLAAQRLSAALAGARPGDPAQPLQADILEGLLGSPFHAQELWLLSRQALPWLVSQCRCFQVEFAAHCPQLFKHFMGEGIAPELFYCHWLQGLMLGCAEDHEVLRLLDIFVFERSHKIFVRAAIALLVLLEPRLRRDVDDIVKVLFSRESWALPRGALVARALGTKVSRSILREIHEP